MRGTPEERFWAKVNKTDTCWLWTAGRNRDGYGVLGWRTGSRRKTTGAHRVAYELLVGPIPQGLVIDHLCRVRSCVNPDHLEPVTNRENLRRSPLVMASGTHCGRGHEFTPENIYVRTDGYRACRECGRARARDYIRRVRAEARKGKESARTPQ